MIIVKMREKNFLLSEVKKKFSVDCSHLLVPVHIMRFFRMEKSSPNHVVKSYPNRVIFPPQNGSHFTTLLHNFSAPASHLAILL